MGKLSWKKVDFFVYLKALLILTSWLLIYFLISINDLIKAISKKQIPGHLSLFPEKPVVMVLVSPPTW